MRYPEAEDPMDEFEADLSLELPLAPWRPTPTALLLTLAVSHRVRLSSDPADDPDKRRSFCRMISLAATAEAFEGVPMKKAPSSVITL
jgi:hypothetical protein